MFLLKMKPRFKYFLAFLAVYFLIMSFISLMIFTFSFQILVHEEIDRLVNQAQVLSGLSLSCLEKETDIDSFTRQWSAGLGYPVIVQRSKDNYFTSIYEGTDLINTRELIVAFQGINSANIRFSNFLNSRAIYIGSSIIDKDGYLVGALQVVFPLTKLQPQIDLFKKISYGVLLVGLLLGVIMFVVLGSIHKKQLDNYLNIIIKSFSTGEGDNKKTFFSTNLVDKSNKSVNHIYKMVENLKNSFYQQKSNYENILNKLNIGIIVTDLDKNVFFLNDEAKKLFAITNESVIGMSLIKASRNFKINELTDLTIKQQKENIGFIDKYGRNKKYLKIFTFPLNYGALIVLQDLTDTKNVENMRRDFISNVSHELRTPLASLKVLIENLLEGAVNDKQLAMDFLNRMEDEVDKLVQLVNELVELSRLESGQAKFNFTWLNINKIVKRTVERMRPMAQRAGITLTYDLPEGLPLVWGDDNQLELVLVNLIHNSIKFTLSGGSVLVKTYVDENYVYVSIIDTGVGIPQEELSRIFERFYKVDRSRSGEGTGLGLAIARHIVNSHDGKIWAQSEEGKGSTFTFVLKRLPQAD